MSQLERETKCFEAHIEEWRKSHLGSFVVIKDEEIVGFFPTLEIAFDTGSARFGLQDFFVKQILPTDAVNVSFFGQSF